MDLNQPKDLCMSVDICLVEFYFKIFIVIFKYWLTLNYYMLQYRHDQQEQDRDDFECISSKIKKAYEKGGLHVYLRKTKCECIGKTKCQIYIKGIMRKINICDGYMYQRQNWWRWIDKEIRERIGQEWEAINEWSTKMTLQWIPLEIRKLETKKIMHKLGWFRGNILWEGMWQNR